MTFKEQVLNNAVRPETGAYVFDCAFKIKQKMLGEVNNLG